jgi:TetR/AcrR family transcriptional repressor of lmrAB and yxaGH operons
MSGATMTKGERTRAKLVAATSALLQRQGYHATGLSQIVDESGAPRGSLYFYFPGGKEQLAKAALQASGAEWRDKIEAIVDAAPDHGAAIVAVCRMLADELVASDYEHGCPLATVALEASTSSEVVRKTIADHYAGWLDAITARLARSGTPEAQGAQIAVFVLSAMEGALMLSKVRRDPGPLLAVGEMLRAMVGSQPRS